MEISFWNVLISVFGLMLLMVPGFILIKCKLVPITANKHLSNIILYICTTVFMFMGFQRCTYTSEIGINILITAGVSLLVYVVMIVLLWLVFRKKDEKTRVIKSCSVFSNCGYMGLPFLTLVFSKSERLGEILVYASIVMMIFYIFVWTVGVLYSSGDRKEMSFKKIITNPIMIAIFVSLIIFVTVKVPFKKMEIADANVKAFVDQLFNCLEMISNMVTPLSMIIVGMQLASSSLKNIFINKEAYLISALRLVIMPLITLVLVAFLPIDITIKYTIFFLLSMPVATITVLLIINYDGDSSLCSSSILLSNLLSIITIPLLFLLFDFVLKSI